MEIEEWWPRTPEVVRRRLINFPWHPVAPYVMEQVHLAGGPAPESGWWRPERGFENGELFLPQEAHLWILKHPDSKALREKHERDPRANYLGRSEWPGGRRF